MALLSSCCCRYSVRQGSFASGVYTLVYFFLFALLTGNYFYNEVVGRFFGSHNKNVVDPLTTNANASSFNNTIGEEDLASGDVVLICVDFLCEISGFFASILLIRGLYSDRKTYLLPWLVIVPLHTVIDTFTVINIILVYLEHANNTNGDLYFGFVTSITIILDLVLNFINVYVFLCVLSQYQEYLAGRGTAAYEGIRWQGPSVRYEVSGASVGGANGKCENENGSNPCFSDGEKSDVWCEDLVLDRLENNVGLDDWGCNRKSGMSRSSCKTTTIKWQDDLPQQSTTKNMKQSVPASSPSTSTKERPSDSNLLTTVTLEFNRPI